MRPPPIDSEEVRQDFSTPASLRHYAAAARDLGLWASEEIVFSRWLPSTGPLLELGTGAGRVALALRARGRTDITAIDFSEAMIGAALTLAEERGITDVTFLHADARALPFADATFDAALFPFNGLMQIPGRRERRRALAEAARVCRPGARFICTTHDRALGNPLAWQEERLAWHDGTRDPALLEFGDQRFENESGWVFMHVPNRAEVLEDLAATGWRHLWDEARQAIARESFAVRDFSDECRFWVAERG